MSTVRRMAVRRWASHADLVSRMARYNLKIIFGNKFPLFFLAAVAFFLLLNGIFVFSDAAPSPGLVYYYLLFPGLLVVFYPSTFGLQSDVDVRMIEILFGIPDYRYKVWLVRLVMMFVLALATLLALGALASLTVMPVAVLPMAVQVMFPVVFWGSLAFMLSTVLRSGSGTAVVMVALGIGCFLAAEPLAASKWNVFLNPYQIPSGLNEVVWASLVAQNRLYLTAASLLAILFGLRNLQKRERFI
ncbi:MAG: hypothetical protein ONB23_02635 [candidate division KSB1 bacterium]|nr:hypothetical protein [candidate division KSB1 bacterium]